MVKATPFLGLLLGGALSVACNDKALEVEASADGGHRASAALTPEQSSKILAQVGDHVITLGDYVAVLEHMDQFDRLRYQSAERRKELLNDMINVELLANEAKTKGYDKDPVAQQEIRGILRDAMLQEARKGAPTPNDISEAEAHSYFDAHRSEFSDPERRRVSAILAKDDKAASDVLDLAKKGLTAAQWGELVRSKSVDPSAKGNLPVDLAGDLGFVGPPGDPRGDNPKVPAEVRAAVFQLDKAGDIYSHSVKTADNRVFVVRLAQKTDAHERSYAEAERGIKVKLVQEKLRAKEEEFVGQLRAEFPVQVDDAVLATVRVEASDAGSADAALESGAPGGPPGLPPRSGRPLAPDGGRHR
jgi:peptidyl-prolyl cis-trans isomerase C